MRLYFLVATIIGLSCLASGKTSLKSEIEAWNKPIRAALLRGDIDGFKKAFKGRVTSDFVFTEGDTTMNFEQMIGRMRFGYSTVIKMSNVTLQVLSVKEQGKAGTVVVRQTDESITKGSGRMTHSISEVDFKTETFRKVNGQWMLAAMWVETRALTVDGKLMPVGGAKHPREGSH